MMTSLDESDGPYVIERSMVPGQSWWRRVLGFVVIEQKTYRLRAKEDGYVEAVLVATTRIQL